MRSGEKILADIDATLDQLIKNAETCHIVPVRELEENEIEALQKTQESLLARLLHMEALLESDQKIHYLKKHECSNEQRHEKIAELAKLNGKLMQEVASRFKVIKKKRRIGRRIKTVKRDDLE